MDKRKMKKAVVAGVIIAELAVLDYAAWTLMRNGVSVELDSEEQMEEAMNVALEDMIKEGE